MWIHSWFTPGTPPLSFALQRKHQQVHRQAFPRWALDTALPVRLHIPTVHRFPVSCRLNASHGRNNRQLDHPDEPRRNERATSHHRIHELTSPSLLHNTMHSQYCPLSRTQHSRLSNSPRIISLLSTCLMPKEANARDRNIAKNAASTTWTALTV